MIGLHTAGRCAVLAGLLLVAGCRAQRSASDAPEPDTTAVAAHADTTTAIPDDLAIIVGTTGMGSGGMRGWTLYADGRVLAWAGKAPEAVIQGEGVASGEALADAWQAIREARLMETTRQAIGGSTAFINVTASGEARRVEWPRGPDAVAADSTLEGLYAHLRTMAETALRKP